jgi:hypothetical protein
MASLRAKAAAVVAAAGLAVAGCAVASHVSELQPHSVTAKSTIDLPRTDMRLGIDVDWYVYSPTGKPPTAKAIKSGAAKTVAYVLAMHANAISISFPFFMHGKDSHKVYGTIRTPTPRDLSVLILDAQRVGLTVSLRPLLDEHSLGMSRTRWRPRNEAAWFRSYRHFLHPYLVIARRHNVAEFIEGTEFSAFETAPGWARLDKWASSIYHGTLACAANWGKVPARICGGVTETVDAYAPQSPGHLLAGWESYDQKLPSGTTLTEVGIAAAPRAYQAPYQYKWAITQPDASIQGRWFTAACHAAQNEHLGGIYFWSIQVGQDPTPPSVTNQDSWSAGPGAQAIKSCFKSLDQDIP